MHLLHKLKGRSVDEAYVRSRQAGGKLAERLALALGRPGARPRGRDAAVPGAFAACVPPIPGLRSPRATAASLAETWSAAARREAEAILDHRYTLFGGGEFDFGAPPDWHFEPRAGVATPRRHWSRIAYLDPAVAGDKKIVWELNRQQYLMTLGRAYAYTGDERYAAAALDHMRDWTAANPPGVGINWASSLEVAYRAIAWLWTLFLVRSSPSLAPPRLAAIVAQLRRKGRHVETYLSTYFSPNTHLTGEALGLLYLGTCLPFLPEAPRWTRRGRDILARHLRRQVRPDGTYFENATYYHRYTLDIFVHAAVLAEGSGRPLDAESLGLVEALADALAAQIKPDGTHGFFGDDDGGRLLPLGETARNDFRPALGSAAVLFGRADLKACAGPLAEESAWLFGAPGVERYARLAERPRPSASRALPDGGVFVMRDGGGAGANQLVVDCGPHGAMNCGHAHADALAFELVAGGRSLLMDAGTYTYTACARARRDFRSTAYHNAVTVDGHSSSEPDGPFSWSSIARCRLHEWRSTEHFDVFDGSHDGFLRLDDPVECRRSILFIKGGYWILLDRLRGARPHALAQHFHFAPDCTHALVADAGLVREAPGAAAGLDVVSFAPGGEWTIRDSWISTRYTDRRPSRAAAFEVTAASADIVTFLVPRRDDDGATPPRAAGAGSGRAYEFRPGPGIRDLVALRSDGALAADGVAGDADWVWTRRRGGALEGLVASAATTITVDGRTLFEAAHPAGISLLLADGSLHVDVADGVAADGAELDLGGLGGSGLRCSGIVANGRHLAVPPDGILRFGNGGPARRGAPPEHRR